MDWQSGITIVIVGVLFFLMMRGCVGKEGCCDVRSTSCDARERNTKDHNVGSHSGEK
jgi:hypothetical protein